MRCRWLIVLCLLIPLAAGAVYFPGGIDWTNPSQSSFVQSLYLNMLGRAPTDSETRTAVRTLRRNDNRTARLRTFDSILQSAEYRGLFANTSNNWRVFQAPDYNYPDGHYRYRAATTQPDGFSDIPNGARSFTERVAESIAHYYNAFCYTGEPCIDNPEFARNRHTNALAQQTVPAAHTCADQNQLTSQFKWVAVNGTTYPQGTDRNTVCVNNGYFKINQLSLERFDCDPGYSNCSRNQRLDLRASRAGNDSDGHASLFFRDGSRLARIETASIESTSQLPGRSDNSGSGNNRVVVTAPTDPLLADAHACADPSQTKSRFTWQTASRSAESKGIGTTIVCMDNYYYAVKRTELHRYNCESGFINCTADPRNNLTAVQTRRINGNPALEFANGTTLILTNRNVTQPPTQGNSRTPAASSSQSNNNRRPSTRPSTRPESQPNRQPSVYSGSDCANSKLRLSQFRWKSQGLSSWPDGIDGKIICLNDSYYEVTRNSLLNFSCQRNYSNCTANPAKNLTVQQTSDDGTVWTLTNGDQITLITR